MRLLLSISLALLGSIFGSAMRSAVKLAEERLEADRDAPPAPITTTISASPAAAIGGGTMGLLFGPRTAFWAGMALGAAGAERLDGRLLALVGVDLEGLIARATAGAVEAAAGAAASEPAASEPPASEPPASEPAASEREASAPAASESGPSGTATPERAPSESTASGPDPDSAEASEPSEPS